MKKFVFPLILISITIFLCLPMPAYSAGTKHTDVRYSDFNGDWVYNEGEVWFYLHLEQQDRKVKGWYSAVIGNGSRIDGIPEETENISGIVKDNVAEVEFKSDWGGAGKVKIIYKGDKVEWLITEVFRKGYYCPDGPVLLKEKQVTMNEFIDNVLHIEWYFKGYKTTYKDWTPLITEIQGETVAYHDSNLFLMAYERELEKKYDVELDGNNFMLKDFDEYFAERAEKDGSNILITTLIEDFYIERGLLP